MYDASIAWFERTVGYMKIDWENIPTIDAKRVSLRHFTASDADAIYEIHADPKAMRYLGDLPMVDQRQAKDFLAEAIEDLRRQLCIQWGIARRSNNRLIGTMAFFKLDIVARRAEIGFALGRAHWGMGYMQEALQATLGYAFNELDLRRIEADVDPRNLPSIRLLERIGFQKEGYLRERWLVPDQTQDALFYGLLKREWNSVGAVYEVVPSPWSPTSAIASLRARIARSRLRRWTAAILSWLH